MSHEKHDIFGLSLAQRVAEGLREHPEWIALAKGNIARWSQQNAGAPGLVACYREWGEILDLPMGEVIAALLDPSDRGQRLRQNSPFAGVFSAAEVWRMKRQAHEATRA